MQAPLNQSPTQPEKSTERHKNDSWKISIADRRDLKSKFCDSWGLITLPGYKATKLEWSYGMNLWCT